MFIFHAFVSAPWDQGLWLSCALFYLAHSWPLINISDWVNEQIIYGLHAFLTLITICWVFLSVKKIKNRDASYGDTYLNPKTQEAEVGWLRVSGQLGLHSETVWKKKWQGNKNQHLLHRIVVRLTRLKRTKCIEQCLYMWNTIKMLVIFFRVLKDSLRNYNFV